MSAPSRSLQDTVVVVTGAGGGIGGATARLALEAGAKVVAGEIAEKSPTAIRFLKQSFNADTDHQAGLSNLAMSALDLYTHTPEGLEGAIAFAEKRSPDFAKFAKA